MNGEIGFLRDERRLVVSLTRARYNLWFIGDEHTLKRDPNWARLLDDCKQRGFFCSLKKVLGGDAPEWLGQEGLRVQFRRALADRFSSSKLAVVFEGSLWKMEFSAKVFKAIQQLREADLRRREQEAIQGKGSSSWEFGKGLIGLVDLLGSMARGEAFSLRRAPSLELCLKVPHAKNLFLFATVDIDEGGLTQVLRAWDVTDSRQLHLARQAAQRRIASKPSWYRAACEVVVVSDRQRVPKVWSSLGELEATGGGVVPDTSSGAAQDDDRQAEEETEEGNDRLELNCFFEVRKAIVS